VKIATSVSLGVLRPPHLGHVAALQAAAASGRFDRIVVTVAAILHEKSHVDAAELRLAWLTPPLTTFLSLKCPPSRFGALADYTIDTVRELLVRSEAIDLIVGLIWQPTQLMARRGHLA